MGLFSKDNDNMFMIVGLGNPGIKYQNTRHNVGFRVMDVLERELNVKIDKSKFSSHYALCRRNGARILLLKPQTFMNLSGDAVMAAAKFHKIPFDRVIIIYDDVSLEPGVIRIRKQGTDGGHNGIKSINERLKTQTYPRIKIGVGHPEERDYDLADWVLGTFPLNMRELMEKAQEKAAAAALGIIEQGTDAAISKYNGATL